MSILKKKHREQIDNPSVRIYKNKIKNRITFKIKTRCYLELLTPETMKVLGSTENETSKDKNGENCSRLEINKVLLVYCSIVNNDYQHDSRISYAFVPNKPFDSLLEISPTNSVFLKIFSSEFHITKYGLEIKIVCH